MHLKISKIIIIFFSFFLLFFLHPFKAAASTSIYTLSGNGMQLIYLPGPVKVGKVNILACSNQNRNGGFQVEIALLYNNIQVAYQGTLRYARSGCPMWSNGGSPTQNALNFRGVLADTIYAEPTGRCGAAIYRIFYTHEAPECNLSHKTCQGNSCVVISGAGADQCSDDASCAPPPPPTVDLTSWPTWELPEPIHLKWTSTNADSCVASGDWSGNKPTSGDEYLSKPRGTYTFILTCTGPGGSASDTATTKVIQVPRCTFTANPTSIILPQSSTLSWSCQYADTCSIDQGIGSVNNVSGTKQVRPPQTTTYTLSCSGLDGSRSYPATVNVGFVPWIKEVIPR